MATISLSNQKSAEQEIAPQIGSLKTKLEQRKEIWGKIPLEKKKKWITSEKDPIMTLAWTIYKYLDKNFFGEGMRKDG